MPAYSNKARVALLAMAAPLVRSARAHRGAPGGGGSDPPGLVWGAARSSAGGRQPSRSTD
jgi:hypothetical protein